MVYTVGETARMLEVPASTLRYYDKEGLLPFVERSSGGIRMFRDVDFEWLRIIGCPVRALPAPAGVPPGPDGRAGAHSEHGGIQVLVL